MKQSNIHKQKLLAFNSAYFLSIHESPQNDRTTKSYKTEKFPNQNKTLISFFFCPTKHRRNGEIWHLKQQKNIENGDLNQHQNSDEILRALVSPLNFT